MGQRLMISDHLEHRAIQVLLVRHDPAENGKGLPFRLAVAHLCPCQRTASMRDWPPLRLPLPRYIISLSYCGTYPIRPVVHIEPGGPLGGVADQHRVADQHLLQPRKTPSALVRPFKPDSLSRQLSEWLSHIAVRFPRTSSHIFTRELARLKKRLHLGLILRCRPSLNGLYLLWVGTHALLVEHVAKPDHLLFPQLALLLPQCQASLSEPLQHLSQPVIMFLPLAMHNQIILDLRHSLQSCQQLLNLVMTLTGGGRCTHHQPLVSEQPERRGENKQLPALLVNLQLMESMVQIQCNEPVRTLELMPQLLR